MAKDNMQDLMCYQINKFQRTAGGTTITAMPEQNRVPSLDMDPSLDPNFVTPTISPNESKNLKTAYNGLFSCNCSNLKCSSSSLDLTHYYYCPNCELETKKSRTLKFSSGGDVFVDKSHHSYYNVPIRPDHILKPQEKIAELKKDENDSHLSNNNNSNVSSNDNNNCLTVNIQLPKSFDFNLLSNQSHHLSIKINICESNKAKKNLGRSESINFPVQIVKTSQLNNSNSCCDINVERLASTKRNLEFSGWYWRKMDWQDSIRALNSSPIGTFLLRDSGDPNYAFSLSIQTERGPISSRISYRNGKFRLDSQDRISEMMPTFNNVISLIEHYIKFGLVKNPTGKQVQ